MQDKTAILCMSYGTPAGAHDVERYYTHILHGRRPSDEALADLKRRYAAIGQSPLSEITRAQAAALGDALQMRTVVGMKHSPPFIGDALAALKASGTKRIVGLPLAPHAARMSVGAYRAAIEQAWDGELIFINGFSKRASFVDAVAGLVREALESSEPELVVFTAHSLPSRIIDEGDSYREDLLESAQAVARVVGLSDHAFAFQSASNGREPWLGPDLLEFLAQRNPRTVLVCPIGFVADHLEILYDLDIEAAQFCEERGMEFRRTASFNARPEFVDVLADAVTAELASTVSN